MRHTISKKGIVAPNQPTQTSSQILYFGSALTISRIFYTPYALSSLPADPFQTATPIAATSINAPTQVPACRTESPIIKFSAAELAFADGELAAVVVPAPEADAEAEEGVAVAGREERLASEVNVAVRPVAFLQEEGMEGVTPEV